MNLVIHEELKTAGQDLVRQATAMAIADEAGFQRAGLMLRATKEFLRRVEEVFGPIVKKAHETWREAIEQKKKIEAPALEAEQALKTGMGRWEETQRRLAQAAEAKAAVERERLEDEARLAAAIEAEVRGDIEQATRVMTAPTPPMPLIVPPAIAPPPPKAEGITFRTTYRAEVVDLKALVQAVAGGQVPLAYVEANQSALNQAARALKEELAVPGVRVIAERGATVR